MTGILGLRYVRKKLKFLIFLKYQTKRLTLMKSFWIAKCLEFAKSLRNTEKYNCSFGVEIWQKQVVFGAWRVGNCLERLGKCLECQNKSLLRSKIDLKSEKRVRFPPNWHENWLEKWKRVRFWVQLTWYDHWDGPGGPI